MLMTAIAHMEGNGSSAIGALGTGMVLIFVILISVLVNIPERNEMKTIGKTKLISVEGGEQCVNNAANGRKESSRY